MIKSALLALLLTFGTALGLTGITAAQAAPISFQVSNRQAGDLGQVTVSTANGNYYVSVPGNSNAAVDIPDTAVSVTIYGQRVPQGIRAIVTLPGGKHVIVLWVSTNVIDIIDEGGIG